MSALHEIIKLSEVEPVSMAEEWFQFATKDHFWMQWRLQALLSICNLIPAGEGRRFLEVGCGSGVFREQLEEALGIPVDGCDLSENSLKQAKRGLGSLLLYNIHDHNEALASKYDAVFLMDVIEHIEDDKAFLSSCLWHLKPGGVVVINVPAIPWLYSTYDVHAGHKRRYTESMLRELLRSTDSDTLQIIHWGFPVIPVVLLRKFLHRKLDERKVIKNGFAPSNKSIDRALRFMHRLESLVNYKLPLGTSILAIGRVREK